MTQKRIPVIEIFGPTIQGEGHVTGLRTIFLRTGGCDFRCTFCDSMHAVDPQQIKARAVYKSQQELFDDLHARLTASNCTTVTISGGNPAMHDLSELVAMLHNANYKISVETQGTIWRDWLGQVDWLTVSPKGPSMISGLNHDQLIAFLDKAKNVTADVSLKVVIFDKEDLKFAEWIAELNKGMSNSPMYLSQGSPVNPGLDEAQYKNVIVSGIEWLLEELKQHPILNECRVLPQVHALIWGQKEGV